jgi:hypothetical protein
MEIIKMVQLFSSDKKVICQECGKSFGSICQHIKTCKSSNGMGIEDYKRKYVDYPLYSYSFIANMKKHNMHFKNRIPEGLEHLADIDITDSNIISVNSISNKNIVDTITDIDTPKNIEPEIQELKLLKDDLKKKKNEKDAESYIDVLPSKINILKCLKKICPESINNFMIEKVTLSGFLEYKFITDIADPTSKIDFEFPNTFWHNQDTPNVLRNKILERDGWRVIIIKSNSPNITDIKKHLDFVTD